MRFRGLMITILICLVLNGCGNKPIATQAKDEVVETNTPIESSVNTVLTPSKVFDGEVYADSGVIIKKPSSDEVQQFLERNVDATTYPLSIINSETLEEDGPLTNQNISFTYNNEPHEITISYVVKNGEKVIITNNNTGYVLTKMKDEGQYLMEYEDNLFRLDSIMLQVVPLLNDSPNGFERTDLEKIKRVDEKLIWGSYPMLIPNKDVLVFSTNRRSFINKDSESVSDIWIKDLNTGEEKLLFPINNSKVLGWSKDQLILFDESGIYKWDITNDKKEIVSTRVITPNIDIFVRDSEIYIVSELKITKIDPNSLEETLLLELNGNSKISVIAPNPTDTTLAVIYLIDNTKFDTSLILIDNHLNIGAQTKVEVDENQNVTSVSWIDENQFIVRSTDPSAQIIKSSLIKRL